MRLARHTRVELSYKNTSYVINRNQFESGSCSEDEERTQGLEVRGKKEKRRQGRCDGEMTMWGKKH